MPSPFAQHYNHRHLVASIRPNHDYFTEFTYGKAIMYFTATVYVLGTGLASIMELFWDIPCRDPGTVLEFENPAYDGSRCPHIRYWILMGLTKEECSFGRRLVASIVLGGLIGWERRQADRPAGIRTMSLVSLGSCLFTINSTFAFVNGPMNWDASRISAAIPSGVGFLGAGLIFKKEEKDASLVVHGLTTAASVWISAAVGIACGGELYFAASFGVAIMMLLLRFGPRSFESDHEDEDDSEEYITETKAPSERLKTIVLATDSAHDGTGAGGGGDGASAAVEGGGGGDGAGYGATSGGSSVPGEEVSLLSAQEGLASMPKKKDAKSIRRRAALASMV
ncbi:MgtC/SapB family membrane protein [Nitzschia inconspicua]|uniref:MgtC/SapB family membrane protein n=1 Tax=Nitzschia inconspicua TaxID=303405 RepID=A0A9K3LSC7_9STRA|nr:MgtC/SapB family membrane protein [Nitzschia inconspicua]